MFRLDDLEALFFDIWSRRRRLPQVLTSWVDTAWSEGRRRYLTFLLRVTDATVITNVLDLQRKLEAFPCIDPFPIHYFHVTVKGVGFFTPSTPCSDDLSQTDVDHVIDHATAILKAFPSFEVRLTHLNYFSEVICIEVHDNNHIRAMNHALLDVPEIPRMAYDYPRFLPHFSVAQFRNDEGFDDLIDYLEAHRPTSFGTLTLNVVDLVVAHLPRWGRYPWLETVCEFRLG
jgi:2'-5' RNA ligase